MDHFPHTNWVRPQGEVYPKIWSVFKTSLEGELHEFFIQDLSADHREEALKFLVDYTFEDEPLLKAYGLSNDKEVIKTFKSMWTKIIAQKAALACYKTEPRKIVGINMTYVVCRGDFGLEDSFSRSCIDRLRKPGSYNPGPAESHRRLDEIDNITNLMFRDFNEFRHFDCVTYMTGRGLAVDPAFRRKGLALELLKAREFFCKEFDIPLTLNLFSSNAANMLADKAGFQLHKSLSYEDIRKEYWRLPQRIDINALTLKYKLFPN